jgi:hypothetical protein
VEKIYSASVVVVDCFVSCPPSDHCLFVLSQPPFLWIGKTQQKHYKLKKPKNILSPLKVSNEEASSAMAVAMVKQLCFLAV